MKLNLLSLLLFSCLFLQFSCNTSPQTKERDQETGQRGEDSLAAGAPGRGTEANTAATDPLFLKLTGNSGLLEVSAGGAAGILQLKAPSDTLHALLGKADSTAVDMCKDLSSWTSGEGTLRIYSLCDNDLDMRKSMQIISVTGFPFTTDAGVSAESTFQEIKQSYPGIKLLGKVPGQAQTFFVADDAEQGIAFELSDTSASGRCLGVLIHLPGKPVTATNIPLYPSLEKR